MRDDAIWGYGGTGVHAGVWWCHDTAVWRGFSSCGCHGQRSFPLLLLYAVLASALLTCCCVLLLLFSSSSFPPQALFRPVTMIVPDFLQICEIMLFSEGFEFARTLAKKMTTLCVLCRAAHSCLPSPPCIRLQPLRLGLARLPSCLLMVARCLCIFVCRMER